MRVDSEFINKIADLKESWENDEKYFPKDDPQDLLADLQNLQNDTSEQDERYVKMLEMLENLNEEEWDEFLAIYYSGYFNISIEESRKNIKSYGKIPRRAILHKTNLVKSLRKADLMM